MENRKLSSLSVTGSGIVVDLFASIMFLFFIQQITFLVESIYMMNLLHRSMDSKALGLLLLAMPVLLFFIGHRKSNYIIIVSSMLFCILLSPILPTSIRIFSSGLGAGLFLLFLALQFSDKGMSTANWGKAAALATLTSIAFRAAGHSLDISLSGNTKFIGWTLMLMAVPLFYLMIKGYPLPVNSKSQEENTGNNPATWFSILGLAGSVLLIYFAFSSPGVIARWTEGNYVLINLILCVSLLIFVVFGSTKILRYSRLKELLLVLNGIFLLLLLWNFLLHRVSFPLLPESAPVVVGEASLFSQLITYLMLIFSPVIFINIAVLSQSIKPTRPAKLAGPFLVAVVLIIFCVFILILSNTWGYSRPFSLIFRNQFHLPFVLAGIFMLLPYFFIQLTQYDIKAGNWSSNWSKILSVLLLVLCCSALYVGNNKQAEGDYEDIKELTVMTYNIQQGVDLFGHKNYEGQLALIDEINPDVICLQESDGSRISGGNSDVVRYFAEKLGYYSYYGPKPVSGTFGTAILSRFPMDSCRTIYTYSTKDEIGTAVAVISAGNQDITLICSHPAGKDVSRQAHVDVITKLAKENEMVIAVGDYNFNQKSPYYQKITTVLKDAWLTLYPDAIGPVASDKLDLSLEKKRKKSSGILLEGDKIDMQKRIDHIFLSMGFDVEEARYLPAPESGSDHPAHWAVLSWE